MQDMNKIPNKNIGICLTSQDLKLIKKVANENYINQSALVRMLLNKTDLNIEGITNKQTLNLESRSYKTIARKRHNVKRFYIPNDLMKKLNTIKNKYKTTASEVIRFLLNDYTQSDRITAVKSRARAGQELTKKTHVITNNNNNFFN